MFVLCSNNPSAVMTYGTTIPSLAFGCPTSPVDPLLLVLTLVPKLPDPTIPSTALIPLVVHGLDFLYAAHLPFSSVSTQTISLSLNPLITINYVNLMVALMMK